MKYLLALLLLIPSVCFSHVLVVRVCDEPVLFIYDHEKKMYVVPVTGLDEEHGSRILSQIKDGKVTVFDAEDQSTKAVCGVAI